MIAREPVIEVDLFEYIPPEGEDRHEIIERNGQVFINLEFEQQPESSFRSCSLRFSGVCAFFTSRIPGVELLNIEFEEPQRDLAITRYQESDAANKWNVLRSYSSKEICHFSLYLFGSKKRIDIFAQSFDGVTCN